MKDWYNIDLPPMRLPGGSSVLGVGSTCPVSCTSDDTPHIQMVGPLCASTRAHVVHSHSYIWPHKFDR